MDAVKSLLDPCGYGIPRRAVVLPETGLVCDKTRAPDLPELDCLSQLCHVLFGTEPRDPELLMRRALDDIPAAWDALKDDLLLGISFDVPHDLVGEFVRVLSHAPNATQAYVCLKLVPQHARIESVLLSCLSLRDDLVLNACSSLSIDVHTMAHMLVTHPRSAAIFVTHPKLLDVYRLQPTVCTVLCDHAMTLPVNDRYPPLSVVAQLVHSGIAPPKDHPVVLDTLTTMRRNYDVKLAAAAAVLGQSHSDPTVRALSRVIETLGATIQRLRCPQN